ncbi:MAG: hypothetical protein IPL65_14800 [Lewinellaceae bacterium]|nr:hypothetical protein [Lewinellaceae bacterium]
MRILLSISLSLLMLASSVSLTINEHWCGGKVASMALFVKPHSCGMGENAGQNNCSNSAAIPGIKKKDCCHDETVFAKGLDYNAQAAQYSEFPAAAYGIASADGCCAVCPGYRFFDAAAYQNYKPPLIVRDFAPLIQVFRI